MDEDETDQPAEGWSESLPDAVRRRVISRASATLPELAAGEVPTGLRPFVRFTPQRRTKLAANALASALATDDVFRRRVGEHLRHEQPELVDAVLAGAVPSAADPVEVAVVAYVLRPAAWEEAVRQARQEVDRAEASESAEREAEQLGRLRDQVSQERTAAREMRDKLRRETARVKEENQNLRQKLRQARDRAQVAETESARLADEVRQSQTDAAEREAQSEAELRRLRARLADAERAVETNRRAARQERDGDSVRLRLLVDTMVEAAQGLRRELALPPAHELPADAVPGQAPARPSTAGAGTVSAQDDVAYLNAALAMPRVHLVLDGYNVTKTAWPSLPLQAQRERLVSALGNLVARTGAETTCVFDGADVSAPPPMTVPRGVRVRFSPAGVSADDLIAQLVAAEPSGRPVVVASSDREVADRSRRLGAQPVSVEVLLPQLGV